MNHISVMLRNVWLREIKISLWTFHYHTFQKWLLLWFLDCWLARVGLHTSVVAQQKSSVNAFVCVVDCFWELHMQWLIWWPSAKDSRSLYLSVGEFFKDLRRLQEIDVWRGNKIVWSSEISLSTNMYLCIHSLHTRLCVLSQLHFYCQICWWYCGSGPHFQQWWDRIVGWGRETYIMVPGQLSLSEREQN